MSRADLRDGGTWSRRQRLKNDVLWALASLLLHATRPLGVRGLRRAGRALGACAYLFARGAKQTALANVARVFPRMGDRTKRAFVRQCFASVGEHLGESAALLRPERALAPLPMCPQARALIAEARGEGRGVVFASAHLGPWEVVAASIVAAGVPLVTLARESYDPRFSRLYAKLRSARGVRVIWRSGRNTATRIVRTLRSGLVLGVPMDLQARVPSLEAPFLGHPAPTAVGPARIALRTGAAVVVGTAAPWSAREGGLGVTATRIPTHDLLHDEAGWRELTRRINAELSHRILALPHSWLWMHERWREKTGV